MSVHRSINRLATGVLNYDANDRVSTDSYDANGNTTFNSGQTNVYDFENRLVQRGGAKIVYDGDGNRVKETVATVTTSYLVADQNPTGYAQVLDELQGGAVTRTYSYGLELINQRQPISGTLTTSYYGYDGHGSVRFLTSSTGAVTDTYDYDAFGNLISSTGSTPNNYLFAGEQFDPALGIYYNRARYYDQRQGRFWTMDTVEGNGSDPSSLHKYLYAAANPVNLSDQSGNDFLGSVSTALGTLATLATTSLIAFQNVISTVYFNLYKVPSLIHTAQTGIAALGTIASAALLLAPKIENVIEDMQRSADNYPSTYSSSPTQMGLEFEQQVGGNLKPGTPAIDRLDVLDGQQVVTQIQATRSTDPSSILQAIYAGVNKLIGAPRFINTAYKNGAPITVDMKTAPKILFQAVPENAPIESYPQLISGVQQLEKASGIIIEITEAAGLDKEP